MEGAADVAVEAVEAPPADGGEEEAPTGVPEAAEAKGSDDKATRRKDANRVSAKKSRERKANALETVRKENDLLKAHVAVLQAAVLAAGGVLPAPPVAAPDAPAGEPAGGGAEGGGDTDAALPIKKQKR
jgi:hypothetical protein